jgi:integrase
MVKCFLPLSLTPFQGKDAVARQPKLRKKKVGKSLYWFTKTGGDTYFGSVATVPLRDARQRFMDHVQSLVAEQRESKGRTGLTAGELMDLFLDWIAKNRSKQTYTTRLTYCSRFGALIAGKGHLRDIPATKVRGADLEAFLEKLKSEGLDPQTRLHAETSVRHCWNWATKYPSPASYLPSNYRPFSGVERTHVPLGALRENHLLTPAEIESLFFCGALDLHQFRGFGLKSTLARTGIDDLKQSGDFTELLKCYYHTGARTDELISCDVGDVLTRTRQIILGRHKRSMTQRMPTIRHITLNDEAFEILLSRCAGKQPTDKLFLNENNRPWTVRNMAKRFARVKELASSLKRPIRDQITIYDFRHLWISESLMAGNDIATVARMAGTSVAMIERVYGHFRNEHLQRAQERLDQARRERKT